MRLQCNGHKRSGVWGVGLAALCAIFFMMSAAAFGQTAVDHFSQPRSNAAWLQLGSSTTPPFNRVQDYSDPDNPDPTKMEYMEKASMTASGTVADLSSGVDLVLYPTMEITTQITIRGNHTLKVKVSVDGGTVWRDFKDPMFGTGKLSPDYNNGTHDAFVGPLTTPLCIDFRGINQGAYPSMRIRFEATASTTPNPDGKDRVALTNEMDNWESALNPVNGVKVDFDNSTAVVNVDPGYDTRGNIIGIYRSADGGTTWQYQGDMMSYPNGNFFQQDVTNGVQYRYGAERRDAYSNYSARVNASPGQATCDGRPGETRITADKGGGSLNAYWFPRTGTEVPCGSPGPVDAYRIYAGTIGQPESTFTFVQEIPYEPLHPTSWSLGYIPDEDVAFVVRSVRNGVEE